MPARPQPIGRPQAQTRDRLILLGLIVFVIIGLVGLAAATGWEETLEQVRKLSLWQLAVLLVLSLVNYGFRGFRWHLFARRLGLGTGLVQDMRHFLGGLSMAVTPGRLGELVRMRWLSRETGASFERTAPLMLVDRATDLAAMALILVVALAFSTSGISGALPVTVMALVGALIATRASWLRTVSDMAFRIIGRWPRLFVRVRRAARSLSQFSGPMVMGVAAFIGALGWVAEGYAFYLLLGWMGADTSLATAMAIFIFSTLAGGLTGAPGGIGGAEAAMVALLTLEGVPPHVSLPATAIIRLTTLWFAILIGMAVFPMAERMSKRGLYAVE